MKACVIQRCVTKPGKVEIIRFVGLDPREQGLNSRSWGQSVFKQEKNYRE